MFQMPRIPLGGLPYQCRVRREGAYGMRTDLGCTLQGESTEAYLTEYVLQPHSVWNRVKFLRLPRVSDVCVYI